MKRTITLDKNAGSKKFRNACNEEGIVRCILLPHEIRDQTDDIVLDFGIRNGYLILTFDKPLFAQNARLLAASNPGLLLVSEDDNAIRKINTKTGAEILKKFKAEFAEWSSNPWKNSYVEITPTFVHVFRTSSNPPERTEFNRNDPSWRIRLKEQMQRNADTDTTLESGGQPS